MGAALWGLSLLIYYFFKSPLEFILDKMFLEFKQFMAKSFVAMQYLLENGDKQLLSFDNAVEKEEWSGSEGSQSDNLYIIPDAVNDFKASTELMVIPSNRVQPGYSLSAIVIVILVAVEVLWIVAFVRRAVFAVKRWKHLAKEKRLKDRTNELLEMYKALLKNKGLKDQIIKPGEQRKEHEQMAFILQGESKDVQESFTKLRRRTQEVQKRTKARGKGRRKNQRKNEGVPGTV